MRVSPSPRGTRRRCASVAQGRLILCGDSSRGSLRLLSLDFARDPVVAQRDEFRMTKMVIERPLKEFDRRHQSRLEPCQR